MPIQTEREATTTTEGSTESNATALPSVNKVTTQKPNSTPGEVQFDDTDKYGNDSLLASCKYNGAVHKNPIKVTGISEIALTSPSNPLPVKDEELVTAHEFTTNATTEASHMRDVTGLVDSNEGEFAITTIDGSDVKIITIGPTNLPERALCSVESTISSFTNSEESGCTLENTDTGHDEKDNIADIASHTDGSRSVSTDVEVLTSLEQGRGAPFVDAIEVDNTTEPNNESRRRSGEFVTETEQLSDLAGTTSTTTAKSNPDTPDTCTRSSVVGPLDTTIETSSNTPSTESLPGVTATGVDLVHWDAEPLTHGLMPRASPIYEYDQAAQTVLGCKEEEVPKRGSGAPPVAENEQNKMASIGTVRPNDVENERPERWYNLVLQDTIPPSENAKKEMADEGVDASFAAVPPDLSAMQTELVQHKVVLILRDAISQLVKNTLAPGHESHVKQTNTNPAPRPPGTGRRTCRARQRADYPDKKHGGLLVWPGSQSIDKIRAFPSQGQNVPHNNSSILGQQQPSSVQLRSRNHRNKSSLQPKHQSKKEPSKTRSNSSAINNSQLGTSTQNASQHSQSQSPPPQRQNALHISHNLGTDSQQPATSRRPRRLGRDHPSQARNQVRHPLPRDSHIYRTPHNLKS